MLMKTSSAGPVPPRLDRSKAWSCLVTNLLVMPGLGSIMARRKIAGYLQMALALGGFIVTLVALIRIVLTWAQEFQLPDDPGLYRAAIIGIAVFLLSWFWSLLTSLTLFRSQ
jgi:hypothetical protein